MNNLICWHNGNFKTLSEVNVSPLDFGFIHSEATYDVMRAKNKKILFSDLHVSRFKNSCEYFYFNYNEQILQVAKELLEKNNLNDAFVWTIAWRGTPPSGSPRDLNAPQHDLVYVKPYYGISTKGINLLISQQHHRVSNLSYNQTYKNFGWIEFNLAQREAVSKGFDSALLLNSLGYITEGPGFGVCFIKDKKVFTPLHDCLGSVTITVVENICKEHGIDFYRANISGEEVSSFDECFIASTSGGITIVNSINEKQFSHETTSFLKDEYEKRISV